MLGKIDCMVLFGLYGRVSKITGKLKAYILSTSKIYAINKSFLKCFSSIKFNFLSRNGNGT